MFRKKTVFVVGAGASYEFDMPLGGQLISRIRDRAARIISNPAGSNRSDEILIECMNSLGWSANAFLPLLIKILNASRFAQSIDNLLHAQSNDANLIKLGKILIALELLEAEASSNLALSKHNQWMRPGVESSWIYPFFHILASKINPNNVNEIFDNISIISFNYDRCIKQFLVKAMSDYFGMDNRTSESICRKLKVVFPYGTFGPLPWDKDDNFRYGLSFGNFNTNIVEVSENIFTFDESMNNESDVITELTNTMSGCQNIVFLGFAFHDQNMQLLGSTIGPNMQANAFATVYDTPKELADHWQETLKSQYCGGLKRARVANVPCANIFKEYGPMISS